MGFVMVLSSALDCKAFNTTFALRPQMLSRQNDGPTGSVGVFNGLQAFSKVDEIPHCPEYMKLPDP